MNTLLTLNIGPEQEEDLVDYLLELACINGFSSWPVYGHGHGSAGRLSLAEQVTGRRKRVRVEILLEAAAVATVIEGLAAKVGRGITWWQCDVSQAGRNE